MAYSITITNKNGKIMRLYEAEAKNASYRITSKLFKQSLPEDDGEGAIVVNLGRELTLNVPFQLRNTQGSSIDVTGAIYTTGDKLDYLLDTFITAGLEDLYTISVQTTAGSILNKKGQLDAFSIDFAAEKPNMLPGNISISIGGSKQV